MKPCVASTGLSAHSRMTRSSGIAVLVCLPFALWAQGGDKELRASADALFAKGDYALAFQPYQTLVGNNQQDFDLNFRYGVCALHGGADKDEAIKYLKRSTLGPSPPALAWYFLGKAYHTSYQFKEALVAYERYRGTADKKMFADRPVDALELQCRNGQNLLSNLKEIDVHNKMEVEGGDFFRFYDLSSIGGRIVVTPEELKSSVDRKAKDLALVYLPDKGGPIYFASYGKGGTTGRDIYRSELLPNGEFATPVKLAGYINTDQDEDFPFMSPDGKSFYFCSKGHNSMGGYDVFKSTYDKGLDVFGAPVNMDFAVNTPDDDLLYLTDPEGKEACFASGRDSKQGTVHVYRVSTAQAPVNITVLKGTFASRMNAEDRKAHITVQDALTQETVADVATDMNGNYVLSLPRSGKYRFMVQTGPSDKTHVGVVDVPRNDEPRAYRQEMSLVDQGGEKLMIRNYFDQPLEEDMVALALDEIKRRAKLDVGTRPVVAEEKPVEPPSGDPLTRAGFAGDVTKKGAQRLADEDAASLRTATDDIEHQSVAAYSIALENASLSDGYTVRAEELVAQANAATDEKTKNGLMVEAARLRQRARAANQRATAALRAGETLAAERMATQIRAQKAERLSADLTRVMAVKDENAMVIKLVELRTRMDEKNAPDGSLSAAEKMRRMATDREIEAATALTRANTARGEENELVDRIARKKREEDEAKGNKKENLASERTELETQLQAMRDENERAFAKARVAEQETGNARGQAALAKHLATAAAGMTVNELNEEQKGQLAQRIAGNGSRIAAIALDERYDAAIAMEAREVERSTFDWGAPIATGSGEPLAATGTLQRDTLAIAQRADQSPTMVQQGDIAKGQVRQGGEVEQPAALERSSSEATEQNVASGTTEHTISTAQHDGNADQDQPKNNAIPTGSVGEVAQGQQERAYDPAGRGVADQGGTANQTERRDSTNGAAPTGTDQALEQGEQVPSRGTVAAAETQRAELPGGVGSEPAVQARNGNTSDSLAQEKPEKPNSSDGTGEAIRNNAQDVEPPTSAVSGTETTNTIAQDSATPTTAKDSRTPDQPARGNEPAGTSRTDTDLASMKGVVTPLQGSIPPANGTQRDDATEKPINANTGRTEDGALTAERSDEPAPPNAEELAFVQANELAELKQLRAAEKNRSRKDSLDTRIADLERTMRATASPEDRAATATAQPDASATTATQRSGTTPEEQSYTVRQEPVSAERATENGQTADSAQDSTGDTSDATNTPTGNADTRSTESAEGGTSTISADGKGITSDGTNSGELRAGSPDQAQAMMDSISASRPALTFEGGASDALLIADIYPDYGARKQLMQRELEDPKERSAALHGLELMLVDSIDAEQTRQLDHLERHPGESAVVLKRVDRLRAMKEEHVHEADRALEAAEQQYAAGESRAMEDAALARTTPERPREDRPIAASPTPHNDDYVNVAEDREQVYTSTMDHRAEKVGEAIRERDRDLTILIGLEDRIDSLEEVLENMPIGKGQTKLRDKTDRLIDDHMILRMEIGQRMGYITGKEFEAAQDSSKELIALNVKEGLKPNEPMVLMATTFQENAERGMRKAAEMRKRAERTEDIVLRDSLFRTAYAEELTALRDIDRSHTVRSYMQKETFQRGERSTYEQVEQRMFGEEEQTPLADNPPGKYDKGTTVDGRVTTDVLAERPADTSAVASTRFKEFMGGDTASSASLSEVHVGDASSLRSEAERSLERSRSLEQASIAAADRANALLDSAAAAKRSERERLEYEAMRSRTVSDSLHVASLQANETATELDQKAAMAAEVAVFQQRLLKFYYLNDQEQALVVNEEDRSRYFQARAKALEQRDEATRAQERAASTKQLADALLEQSKEILLNQNMGGAALTPDEMGQARLLTDQAVRMNHQVDSLDRAAERLEMAAGVNESQAASMLQSLTPERGTEIMAMEQHARRVEPVLAQARSLQGPASNAQPTSNADVATTPTDGANRGTAPPTSVQDIATEQPTPPPANAADTGSGGIAETLPPPIADNDGSRLADGNPPLVADPPTVKSTPFAPLPDKPPVDAGAPRLRAPLPADLFDMDNVVPRTGPIPIDAPMPSGVVYKVQIGAFKQEIPNELFSDLAPVSGESVGNGLTRYAVGMFTTPEGALKATQTVRERGYRDAFVVAYQDGRRVSLSQAMRAARPVAAATAVTADLPTKAPVRIAAPVPGTAPATPSDSTLAAEQEVLAKYPTSVEQVLAQFQPPTDATAYYSDPKAAPARQVETVRGLFFTVQVGVYSKPTALDKLFNITPLNSERTENAKIRYTTGVFTDMDTARSRKDQTVVLGVKDAFITAYLNGRRIPMRDARALITKFGPSVFADPSIITR